MEIKNNKLIAEFMGSEWHKGFFKDICIISASNIPYKFHQDWNWLIPVVKKVREVINVELSINEYKCVQEMRFTIFPYDFTINQVYQAVVEFIEWYNQKK